MVDFVGNEGTTRIDGFITYAIEIEERSTNNLVLNNQATIQGLTLKTQTYNYVAKLPFQFIDGKDNYVVRIKIIDSEEIGTNYSETKNSKNKVTEIQSSPSQKVASLVRLPFLTSSIILSRGIGP